MRWVYKIKKKDVQNNEANFFYAGFNVETVEYKNISFTVWDVGGQDKVQPILLCLFMLVLFIWL